MIDWVTAKLPLTHYPLDGGRTIRLLPGGVIDWEAPKSLSIPGSYDDCISVSSDGGDGQGRATCLLISGNPAKWLQGHNLFGSDDLLSLMFDVFIRLTDHLSLVPSIDELHQIKTGNYTVSRIDFTHSFELPSRGDVRAWIRAAEFKSRTRHGRPTMRGTTLYYGQHSRFWSFKFYVKGDEIEVKGHELPDDLKNHSDLSLWADNKLRAEATFRQMFLKRYSVERASELTPSRLHELYFDYLSRLDMSEQFSLSSEQLFKLPQRLHMAYTSWLHGDDLRQLLSKSTFYYYRNKLKEHGIDIAIRRDCADRSNVVPLIRILEAKPASIPDFAFQHGLVHQSARNNAA